MNLDLPAGGLAVVPVRVTVLPAHLGQNPRTDARVGGAGAEPGANHRDTSTRTRAPGMQIIKRKDLTCLQNWTKKPSYLRPVLSFTEKEDETRTKAQSRSLVDLDLIRMVFSTCEQDAATDRDKFASTNLP